MAIIERISPARATEAATEGVDIVELLAILRGRWRIILAYALAALVIAGVYVLVAPKLYTATTSILIDVRARTPLGSDPALLTPSSPDSVLVESQVKVISSDAVLRRVAEAEKLGDDPEFVPTSGGFVSTLIGMAGIGGPRAPADDRAGRAASALARVMVVKRSERTYVMDVEITTRDPQKSARLANAIAAAYMADQQDGKVEGVRRNGEALRKRLAELQTRVQDAENKAEAYRQQNRIFNANGKLVSDQELSDAATALIQAKTKTADAKSRREQIEKIIASGRVPDAVNDVLRSPTMDRLRGQYADIVRQEANYRATLGARHPAYIEVQTQLHDIGALIGAEVRRISAAVGNEYDAARANEANVDRQVEGLKRGAASTNTALIRMRELDRDVDASRQAYEKFLRAREALTDDTVDSLTARVIAPAQAAASPSSPKTFPVLVLALMAGFSLGVAHAFLDEYRSRRSAPLPAMPRTASAFPRGLERIGVFPAVRAPALGRFAAWRKSAPGQPPAAEQILHAPPPSYALAARGLYESVTHLLEARETHHGTPMLLVTSVEAGDGKTSVAVNLARAAAQTGERVLLIDGNAERPRLSHLIAPDEPPNLVDLGGAMRLIYRVPGASDDDLSVVPIMASEARVVDRLLRNDRLPILDGIDGHFDLVIVDGDVWGADATMDFAAEAASLVLIVAGDEARLARAVRQFARICEPDVVARTIAVVSGADIPSTVETRRAA